MHQPPTLFLLHFLGGSARSWTAMVSGLGSGMTVVALDLPGFGDDPATDGYGVAAMAESVCGAIRRVGPATWSIAGHSMGAKVATVAARRAEDGEDGLAGLRRIVCIAGSPPAPEPMDEAQRSAMLSWFAGGPADSQAEADRYIAQNVHQRLPSAQHTRAIDDVLRARPAAWRAWLQHGSREDWSGHVGVLRTPALVIAGAQDPHLGPAGQRTHMLRHFDDARMEILPGAKHLLPDERPDEVARLIAGHLA